MQMSIIEKDNTSNEILSIMSGSSRESSTSETKKYA